MTPEYIAGFFDGEGNISIKHRSGRKAQVVACMIQKPRRVLDLICSYLDSLSITSAVHKRKNGIHALQLSHTVSARRFLRLIRPHLVVKAAAADDALAVLDARGTHRDKPSSDEVREIMKRIAETGNCAQTAREFGRDHSWVFKLAAGKTIHSSTPICSGRVGMSIVKSRDD